MARFIVVDDDPSTLRAMTLLLQSDGHAVTPFTDGRGAIDALSRESFDAVVTELDLRDVDGREVVHVSRERSPDACAVLVTGLGAQNRPALLEAGACMVVRKPLDYGRLTAALAECPGRGDVCGRKACHPQTV